MLRFALLIEADPHLEAKPLSHTKLFPKSNEKGLKAQYVNYEMPGIVLPQFDQDIDEDGSRASLIKNIFDLFVRLPYEKETPVYFDTREEYLALYRWELVS